MKLRSICLGIGIAMLSSCPFYSPVYAHNLCTAEGGTLSAANLAFQITCGSDTLVEQYILLGSIDDDDDTEVPEDDTEEPEVPEEETEVPEEEAEEPEDPVVSDDGDTRNGDACSVYGDDLSTAKANYEAACSLPRSDCDPGDGGWYCASYSNPSGATEEYIPDEDGSDDSETTETEDTLAVYIEAESYSSKDELWVLQAGALRDNTSGDYLEVLPDTRVTHEDTLTRGVNFWDNGGEGPTMTYDVDLEAGVYLVEAVAYSTGTEDNGMHIGINGDWPDTGWRVQWCTGKNQWTSSSALRLNDDHCGVQGSAMLTARDGGNVIQISAREDGFELDSFTLTLVTPADTDPVVLSSDLYINNYDFQPDPDDMLAIVAGKTVSESMGIEPVVSYAAIGIQDKEFVDGFEEHALSVFPDALDARLASSVSTVADKVIATLEGGANAYVADGGQSDYTADIVREVAAMYSGDIKDRIFVTHHSDWNESNTPAADLTYLEGAVTYLKIDDGNYENSTADFNKSSTEEDCQSFEAAALASSLSAQYQVAFDSLPDGRRCDFSDTIEFLHNLGEPTDEDMDAFTNRYF